ncbi:MAG: hypothetical protein WBW81_12645, partial [Methylocella sp.]
MANSLKLGRHGESEKCRFVNPARESASQGLGKSDAGELPVDSGGFLNKYGQCVSIKPSANKNTGHDQISEPLNVVRYELAHMDYDGQE